LVHPRLLAGLERLRSVQVERPLSRAWTAAFVLLAAALVVGGWLAWIVSLGFAFPVLAPVWVLLTVALVYAAYPPSRRRAWRVAAWAAASVVTGGLPVVYLTWLAASRDA
jgi:hypothetical protein